MKRLLLMLMAVLLIAATPITPTVTIQINPKTYTANADKSQVTTDVTVSANFPIKRVRLRRDDFTTYFYDSLYTNPKLPPYTFRWCVTCVEPRETLPRVIKLRAFVTHTNGKVYQKTVNIQLNAAVAPPPPSPSPTPPPPPPPSPPPAPVPAPPPSPPPTNQPFHLGPESPARGAGQKLDCIPKYGGGCHEGIDKDFNGKQRTEPWDLGIYDEK